MRRIGHDLLNCQAIILGQCELAELDFKSGRVKPQRIARIREAVVICNGLVKSVLFPPTMAPGVFDLNGLIRNVTMLVADDLNGVQPSLALIPGRIPIDGDSLSMTRLLTNVYMNARNAIEVAGRFTGGEINVTTKLVGADAALLTITDNGCGMLAKTARDLFTAARPRPSQDGHGYGLDVMKKAVLALHGTITAESAGLGKGMSFAILLPVAELITGVPVA